MPHYYNDHKLSQAWNINSNLDWFVMNYFYGPVEDEKYLIIVFPLQIHWNWQTYNKIHW